MQVSSLVVRLLVVAGALVLTASVAGAALDARTGDEPAGRSDAIGPSSARTASPSPPAASPTPSPTPERPAELPRGGTTLFPQYRLVGFSGGPGSKAFGRLGIEPIEQRMKEIEDLGRQYAGGRQPQPVMELITWVVHAKPGPNGDYSTLIDEAVIQRWLDVARRHRAILLLNVQPGRADMLQQVHALEKWLVNPDVGIAVDPEWAVGPKQVPGRVYGSTTGAELDGVARYLQGLVAARKLPEKVMVVHQLSARIITGWSGLRPAPGVQVVLSVDGIGGRKDKEATWRKLVAAKPAHVHAGFKLFFEEDAEAGPLMTPPMVLALLPQPEYVLYE